MNANRSQVHVIEDGTTVGRYATVTASNAVKVDGSAVTQPTNLAQWNGVAPTAAAALSDAMANPTAPLLGAVEVGFDPQAGTLFRKPSYVRGTAFSSASRVAGTYDFSVTARGLGRIFVYVTVTVNGGSSTVFAINDSANTARILTITTPMTINRVFVYMAGNGVTLPGGGATSIAQVFPVTLPGVFNLRIISTATSTWSVDYELVP